MNGFNIKQVAWAVIPIFIYVIKLIFVGALRRNDFSYFKSREIPRMGSEFCMITTAILLGAIALGLDSIAFKGSWLSNYPSRDIVAILMIMGVIGFFAWSYICFMSIEGKLPARKRYLPSEDKISAWRWFLMVLVSQTLGLFPLGIVILSLTGGVR
jgi:hypothetical protein